VAEILGYKDTDKSIRNHVDVEDKVKLKKIIPAKTAGLKGNQKNTVMINESGLYSLILSSKLPTAKKFKRWVTRKVLPSIRKTGQYKIPQVDPLEVRRLALDERIARTNEIKLLMELSDGDVKMNTALRDYVMNEITGQKLITNGNEKWSRDLTTLCKEEFNYMLNHVEKITAGQIIKKAYVKQFGKNPEKTKLWCNGAMRKVNAYPKDKEQWIIEKLRPVFD